MTLCLLFKNDTKIVANIKQHNYLFLPVTQLYNLFPVNNSKTKVAYPKLSYFGHIFFI